MTRARRLVAALVLLAIASPGLASAGVRPALPDLVPLQPFGVKIGLADGDPYGFPPRALRFSVAVANRGAAALDLVGVPVDPQRARALQCTAFVEARACTSRTEVGDFVFHPQHAHWHLQAFARYELMPLAADGTPDASAEPVTVADKVSFCLMDLERDPQSQDDSLDADIGVYSTICTGAAQGISRGWMDVYGADLWGQQFLLEEIPDGSYAIVVTVNPEGVLHEVDATNNRSFTRISVDEDGTIVRTLG